MSWQTATVVKIIYQTPDFRSFFLQVKKFHKFETGNFVELAVDQDDTPKCYSIVSTPNDHGFYEIGVKLYKNGELSPKLFNLSEGDSVLMRGPTGVHFIWNDPKRTAVMIAGGAGICPMVGIMRQIKGKGSLLYSTKKGNAYYKEELLKLSQDKKIDYTLVETGRDARVDKKLIIEKFKNWIDDSTDFFVAGPTEFVGNTRYWLQELGVNPANLKTDDFGAE